jgi:hypothetical protein
MSARIKFALGALLVLLLPWASAQAGVFIGVGFPGPCYHRHYYHPYYGPRVFIAAPPVYIGAPPVYVAPAPAPVYVQPAPTVIQVPATPAAAPTTTAALPPAPVPVANPGP